MQNAERLLALHTFAHEGEKTPFREAGRRKAKRIPDCFSLIAMTAGEEAHPAEHEICQNSMSSSSISSGSCAAVSAHSIMSGQCRIVSR